MWNVITENEVRAQLALEASGAGVWSWNAATDQIVADERYRELYGFGEREVITTSLWQQRVHAEDRGQLLTCVADCLRDGEQWRESFRIHHPVRGIRLLEGYGKVRRDTFGHVLGLVGINLDITERDRAGVALRRSEAQLKAVVDGAIDGIITIDERGIVRSFNRAATAIFGYGEADVIGQNVKMLMPEPDRGAHDGYLENYRSSGEARIIGIGREVTGRRSDGTTFPLDLGITEVNQDGRCLFIGVVRDITRRKEAEATQLLLMAELNHRVKNTLATVESMAEQTLRRASDPERFVISFRGRLQALSRAHKLLTQKTWTGVDLLALLSEQVFLAPGLDEQIVCTGPAVELEPQTAVHLGLVLHELGTNARKYGALSIPEGRLQLSWSLVGEDRDTLAFNWAERNGPAVIPPSTQGFGTLLVARGIEHTLRGKVLHAFEPTGVTCEIRLPLT